MFNSWAYTKYATYTQCPLKAKYVYIDKLPEPIAPALANGIRVHEEAELFLKWEVDEVPDSFVLLAPELVDLRNKSAIPERFVSLMADWTPAAPYAKDVWFRAKLDAVVPPIESVVKIVDFKTGKFRMEAKSQLELYAICGFAMFNDVDEVSTELWYVDSGEIFIEKYTREGIPELKKKWERKVRPYFHDTYFHPRPSPLCAWCHFRKGNNGPCQY